MSDRPLVSVIIPAYNAAPYIAAAVDSALAQTYVPVEVVVTDDGSTDGTAEILRPYREAGKITYIYQKNAGLSSARNTGIRACRGEYVALLDSDDLFLPEKIARQVAYLEAHPTCGISYCGIAHFHEESPEKMLRLDYTYYSGADVFPRLLWKNFINPLSVVARRSVFEKIGYFDEDLKRSEDLDFWIRATHGGIRFDYLPDVLAQYRMRKGSMSYGAASDVARKETTLSIFTGLRDRMTPAERERYSMGTVLAFYRLKLFCARMARLMPFLGRLQTLRQKMKLR